MAFVFKPKKQYKFTSGSNSNFKKYPIKLSLAQREFNVIKPVHSYNRFKKPRIANSGVDEQQAYLNFIEKEFTKPYSRQIPLIYDDYKKSENSSPIKWSIGNTYKCNDENLLPKKDPYQEYHFEKRDNEKVNAYLDYYLPTDHMSFKKPKLSNSLDTNNNNYLKMKEEYSINNDSDSFWVPKINKGLAVANQSSVPYNIINNINIIYDNNDLYKNNNDKNINHKKKGIAEFSDFLKPYSYNPNMKYLDMYEKNKNRFQRYKGVFSELYDSNSRNGNMYTPFKDRFQQQHNDNSVSKKESKNHNSDIIFEKMERAKSSKNI